MNKIIITLMAIYIAGDPHLQYLAWLGDLKLYIVAAAIALVSMPWIAEQLDGYCSLRDGPTPSLPTAASGSPILLRQPCRVLATNKVDRVYADRNGRVVPLLLSVSLSVIAIYYEGAEYEDVL